ncbi:hypothetical protein Bbelb_352270 [Branchiostoma belcheri]|nr:hypothetical protein Bbelb_352270 [Branchiostoma belcheri]
MADRRKGKVGIWEGQPTRGYVFEYSGVWATDVEIYSMDHKREKLEQQQVRYHTDEDHKREKLEQQQVRYHTDEDKREKLEQQQVRYHTNEDHKSEKIEQQQVRYHTDEDHKREKLEQQQVRYHTDEDHKREKLEQQQVRYHTDEDQNREKLEQQQVRYQTDEDHKREKLEQQQVRYRTDENKREKIEQERRKYQNDAEQRAEKIAQVQRHKKEKQDEPQESDSTEGSGTNGAAGDGMEDEETDHIIGQIDMEAVTTEAALNKEEELDNRLRVFPTTLVSNREDVKAILKSDEGYRFLQPVRGTPQYWEKALNELYAMIRQLGIPTWFVTFLAADLRRPEVLEAIRQDHSAVPVSDLSWEERCDILKSNPVTAAHMFDPRLFFKHVIQSPSQPIGDVVDTFTRTEFQQRGSPILVENGFKLTTMPEPGRLPLDLGENNLLNAAPLTEDQAEAYVMKYKQSQRFPFSPEVYTARCLLAAIDYNRHKDRPVAKRKSDGEVSTPSNCSCNKDDIDIEPVGPSCTTNFPLADPIGNAEVLARRARDAGGSRVT